MQPAGWYPDPSGQPQSFRFWDGQSWTPVTTGDPNTPWPRPEELGRPGLQPLVPGGDRPGAFGPGPDTAADPTLPPAAQPRSKTPLLIGGAALVALAVAAGVGVWAFGGGEPAPPPTPPPSTAPLSPGGQTPGAAAKLRCDNGNGNATNLKAESYTSTGVRYDSPPNFGFRFSKDYWTWADDFSAWGAVTGGQEAGVVLGGLSAANGFTDSAAAGQQVLSCMEGTMSREAPTRVEAAATEPVSVAGMQGHRTTARLVSPDQPRPLLVTVTVLDSGQPGKLAQLITFVRQGSPAQAQVESAAASLRRA